MTMVCIQIGLELKGKFKTISSILLFRTNMAFFYSVLQVHQISLHSQFNFTIRFLILLRAEKLNLNLPKILNFFQRIRRFGCEVLNVERFFLLEAC